MRPQMNTKMVVGTNQLAINVCTPHAVCVSARNAYFISLQICVKSGMVV